MLATVMKKRIIHYTGMNFVIKFSFLGGYGGVIVVWKEEGCRSSDPYYRLKETEVE
jgi:hypothetical protein